MLRAPLCSYPSLLAAMALAYSELEHRYQLYRGLVDISALINRITELEPLLQAIMSIAQRVMNAEASSLMLRDPDSGDLEMVVAMSKEEIGHNPPPRQRVPEGRGIAGWVFLHEESVLVEDAYQDARFFPEIDRQTGFRTRCVLCVPLRHDNQTIGVLQVLNPIGREIFSKVEQELFEAYSVLAATAIERNRLLESERQRQRLMQELTVATEIQLNFLPRERPALSAATVDWHTQPARQIGGDFFDIYPLSEREVYFVIGDVSGKGIPAALLMAQAMSMLRLILQPDSAPRDLFDRWNSMLLERIVRGTFITAILGRLDPLSGHLELANAGHCPPVICRSGEPERRPVFHGAPPLGILDEVEFERTELTLDPGDTLILYTDGVTETQAPNGDFLDREGLLRLVREKSAETLPMVQHLVREVERFRGQSEAQDDLTLFLVQKQ